MHCVSGTLDFITIGKIPFFAFGKDRECGTSGSLSQSDVLLEKTKGGRGKSGTESDGNFVFIGRTLYCYCVFNT
jgi:hypothetical protein